MSHPPKIFLLVLFFFSEPRPGNCAIIIGPSWAPGAEFVRSEGVLLPETPGMCVHIGKRIWGEFKRHLLRPFDGRLLHSRQRSLSDGRWHGNGRQHGSRVSGPVSGQDEHSIRISVHFSTFFVLIYKAAPTCNYFAWVSPSSSDETIHKQCRFKSVDEPATVALGFVFGPKKCT